MVLDRVLDRATLDQVNADMAPHVEATRYGTDKFGGFQTKRTGMVIARSPKGRELIMNSTLLDVTKRALSHATNFQLHITQVINVEPGSAAQVIHRDQWAFDMFPFPKGFDTTLATMWALSDFTEENGATRVIPGSHQMDDKLQLESSEAEPAEMEAGSVLLYTGSTYHGAGANTTNSQVRSGFTVQYTLGWLRQEETSTCACPPTCCKRSPKTYYA